MSEFEDQVAVTFEGEYVQVTSDGEKSIALAEWQWAKVADTCQKHDCNYVLGIAQTTVPMPTMEGFDHAGLFRNVGILPKYRIAWVELNQDVFGDYYFIESVLRNRGFQIRLFSDIAQAKKWLFSACDS